MAKLFKFLCIGLLIIIGATYVLLVITGNTHLIKAAKSTYLQGNSTSNINDKRDFNTRVITAGEHQPWTLHANYQQSNKAFPKTIKQSLIDSKSAAFIVIHKGKLLIEQYFNGYDNRSKTNSYSMAKTVNTLLVQMAIQEGIINSWDDSIVDYLPEYKGIKYANQVTLKNLSAMDSGLKWDESYSSVTSITTKLYYGNDVETLMLGVPFDQAPNTRFYYSSGSTQLLGIILHRALQAKYGNDITVSRYLSDRLWKPLGMNDDALWHLDSAAGLELTYCCLNTNARNYAKLGELLLNKGQWKNQALLDSSFVSEMQMPRLSERYGLSVWLGEYNNRQGKKSRYLSYNGHLGQHILVAPDDDMVVVRLGERRQEGGVAKTDATYYIELALRLVP